jgi:HAMP domain-containing protein
MEQAKQLNDAVEALGNLQNVLGGIDLSELKVAMRIKYKIAELENELLDKIKDHEFFANYDVETKPEDIVKNGLDDEELFKQALDTITWNGSVQDLDIVSVESVIDEINSLARAIGTIKRQIRDLKDLLN